MNILFTVCGRLGSKGVKNKNCRMFLGSPLVYYTLAAIELYSEQHKSYTIHTCINTDSGELVRLAQSFTPDISAVERLPSLSGDLAPKTPVVADSLRQMEAKRGIAYGCVVDLDITSPLRTARNIAEAVDKRASGGFDVVFSVTEARRNPYFNMVKQLPDGSCEKVIQSDYTTRQQAPAMFDMNASIYAYSPAFLTSSTSGMLFDGRCAFTEMRDTGILDIDSEWDFLFMESIATFLASQDEELKQVFERARRLPAL